MRYRKLTSSGDYTFGLSADNFHLDLNAVVQAIKTRLQLNKESFWRDLNEGLPLFQEILGTSGSEQNLAAIDAIIQNRIKGTPDVLGIVSYSRDYDREARSYIFKAEVQTVYSVTIVAGTI